MASWTSDMMDMLDVQQVATLIGCCRATVYNLINTKKLNAEKIPDGWRGSSWKIRRSEVVNYIDKKEAKKAKKEKVVEKEDKPKRKYTRKEVLKPDYDDFLFMLGEIRAMVDLMEEQINRSRK